MLILDYFSVTEGCFEEHTDYPGNDLDHFVSESPQKCQSDCQKLENCRFWTYVKSDTDSNWCHIKSNKENVNSNHDHATSGPKYCDSSELENLRDPNIYYFFDRKSLSGHN